MTEKKENGFLVISRRKGERVFIGDDIEIILKHTSPSHVKMAIRVPNEMPVTRNKPFSELKNFSRQGIC